MKEPNLVKKKSKKKSESKLEKLIKLKLIEKSK
jgi:hypothetical protein